MIRYLITMGIRILCFIASIFVYYWAGWWALIPLAGAIILPYIAVVAANTIVQPKVSAVERPGSLVVVGRTERKSPEDHS
jgi:hypothetical protein